jgi:hypothetical protein
MARRRKIEPGKFRLSYMRDVLTDVTEKLFEAIQKQNPNCDMDDLESDLRELVKKHGTSSLEVNKEVSTASVKPQYNFAGDLLVAAYNKLNENKTRDALITFISACRAEGMSDLMKAIATMNEEIMQDEGLSDEDVFAPEEEVEAGYSEDEDTSDEEFEDEEIEDVDDVDDEVEAGYSEEDDDYSSEEDEYSSEEDEYSSEEDEYSSDEDDYSSEEDDYSSEEDEDENINDDLNKVQAKLFKTKTR